MSLSLFKKHKRTPVQFQVGVVDDSDDDDFVEPLFLKRKKGRKLNGNDLLSVSSQTMRATVAAHPKCILSAPKSNSQLSTPQQTVRRVEDMDSASSHAADRKNSDTVLPVDMGASRQNEVDDLLNTPTPLHRARKGIKKSLLSLPRPPPPAVATSTPSTATPKSSSPHSPSSFSSPRVLNQWQCNSCTLYNNHHSSSCSMCHAPRTTTSSISLSSPSNDISDTLGRASPDPGARSDCTKTYIRDCEGGRGNSSSEEAIHAVSTPELHCPKCTFLNPPDSYQCELCEHLLQKKTTRSSVRTSRSAASGSSSKNMNCGDSPIRVDASVHMNNGLRSSDSDKASAHHKQWYVPTRLLDNIPNLPLQEADSSSTSTISDTAATSVSREILCASPSPTREKEKAARSAVTRKRGQWSPPSSSDEDSSGREGSASVMKAAAFQEKREADRLSDGQARATHVIHTRRKGAECECVRDNSAAANGILSGHASVTAVVDLTDVPVPGHCRTGELKESETDLSDTDGEEGEEDIPRRWTKISTSAACATAPPPTASSVAAVDIWDEESDTSNDSAEYDGGKAVSNYLNGYDFADYGLDGSEEEDDNEDIEFVGRGRSAPYSDCRNYEDIDDFEDDDDRFGQLYQSSHPVLAEHFTCVRDLNRSGNCSIDFNSFILKSTCMRQSNSYESRQTQREKRKKKPKRKAPKRKSWRKKK